MSKPPAADVAAKVLGTATTKPVVAALPGLREPVPLPPGVRVAGTLEQGALEVLEVLGRPRPELGTGLVGAARRACSRLAPERRAVRGLFSGGTLCYEALVLLSGRLGAGLLQHAAAATAGACRLPPARTSAWTWARRSTPAAAPTR